MIGDEERIRDKLQFFKDRKIEVHISIKQNKQFYNGYTVEFQGDDGVIFKDNVLGETLIFLSQIRMVEPKRFQEEGI